MSGECESTELVGRETALETGQYLPTEIILKNFNKERI
jgi:hypothetical protein